MSDVSTVKNELKQVQLMLEALEIKIAYQEDTIESLNQTIIQQQEKLRNLEYVASNLIEKMKTISTDDGQTQTEVELPPHY